jgi:hypothetical protein
MAMTGRWSAAGLLTLVLTSTVRAQAQPPLDLRHVPAPPPVFPNLVQAVHEPHMPVAVPATQEIEVLDPNVDPRGNPAVVTQPGPDGGVVIDIPPTVLVHRYYYTGNRSFQARLLPGGPCIVVASHPKSGERLYIPVQLPPGAPRVTYTADSIEYDFGTQAVTITFCCLFQHRPKVTYRQGVPFTEKVEKAAVCVRDATRRLVNRTGIPACADKVAKGSKSVVVTTVDRLNDLGKVVVAPPIAVLKATPLANLFTESPEDRATKERDSVVQRARDQALRQENAFINTSR